MWTDAFAQVGGSAPAEANPTMSLLLTLLQFLPIFLILYFLLIRPQQQRQKKLKAMLGALKRGDKVITNGGIIGTIVGLDDNKAVLKIADNVKVEFQKSAIIGIEGAEA